MHVRSNNLTRQFIGFFIVCWLCSHSWADTPTGSINRPNFVLIIADDMAWDDCGAFGNPFVKTPRLDRFAQEGICFDRAFLTISSCSPSRASLLTGRYPHNTDADELHWPLPKEQSTFVEQLKQAGYWTAAAGKWHLGNQVRDRFDLIREVDTSGFQLPSGTSGASGTFQESAVGEAKSGCADWLRLLELRPKDQPFFLWLAAVDPHRPYDEQISDTPHQPATVRLPPYHPDTDKVRADYARYYDEIARLDKYVGKVLDELERQQLSRNTVVIFLSDNGRPFPRDKTTLYDSGIRTPLMIRWPIKIPADSRCEQLVSSVDIGPTLLQLAGLPADAKMDGRTFHTLLTQPDQPIRDYVFAEKNWHDFEDHSRAARSKRFKYIHNAYNDLPNTPPADAVRSPTYIEMKRLLAIDQLPTSRQQCFLHPRPREELYDLELDPFELNNLSGSPKYQDELRRHQMALAKWKQRTHDRIPEIRTADEFDRVTGNPTAARRRPRWSKKRMIQAGLTAP